MPRKEPDNNQAATRRLFRSETDRLIAGVAGGLGEHFNVDPTLIRIVLVLMTVFGGSGALVYLLLWLVIPAGSNPKGNYEESLPQGVQEIKDTAKAWAKEVRSYTRNRGYRSWWGVALLVLGVFLLLHNFGVISLGHWLRLWPLLLIAIAWSMLSKRS